MEFLAFGRRPCACPSSLFIYFFTFTNLIDFVEDLEWQFKNLAPYLLFIFLNLPGAGPADGVMVCWSPT